MIPLRDDIRSEKRPYATWTLMATCVGFFVYQALSEFRNPEAGDALIRAYGLTPRQVVSGRQLWTLFTCMFLHGGFFHLAGNMLYLWIFGDNIEDAFGRFWFLVLYLLTGIAGSLLQIMAMPGSSVPTIGASGAISGVMGAYFILFPRARVLTLIPVFFFMRLIYLPAPILLGFWILFQLLHGCGSAPGMGGGVAYFAHIGGFVAGVILGLAARKRVRRPWYEIS
ncbi:rhomboid family intramembrane serine protease [candidate division WOR-3 bacterium]|nr:rhomboid family intramembrane serine protease [candidate division WOR-3 bacterium]